VSKTDFRGSLGPSKVRCTVLTDSPYQNRVRLNFYTQDINALTLESDAPSLKRKIDFGDSVTPRKRRILESYSTGDMCQVVAVYSDITVCLISNIFISVNKVIAKNKSPPH
jgi:hypothetical protein